ncbi:MAG: 2-succinyl-5-enolpyruvyl-6-hydroxy-3-cyclohexene-1-carboxylic-acid synthase [Dehalococcoidia bacterium]
MSGSAPSVEAARHLVDGLVASGVRHACITPGSRSTPLTVAFARHPGAKAWLHLDERSSSFFALGLARALRAPVALVCTSGTAAANFHPAVAEASLSRVPLVVLTADRPPRLREAGAEQTIAQAGMYGPHVRWAHDLPVPVGAPLEERVLRSVAARGVRTATGPLPGPVHLNVPYEEPLIDSPVVASRDLAAGVEAADSGSTPAAPRSLPASSEVEAAAAAIEESRRPLIVAGPETGGLPPGPMAALADALGAPLIADPLSGLRTGPHDRSHVLEAADALFRDPRVAEARPDAVIRFGGRPTSKPLNLFLAGLEDAPQILCDVPGSWRDPDAAAGRIITGDAGPAAEALARTLAGAASEDGWLEAWLGRDGRARKSLAQSARSFAEPFEGRVFLELGEVAPPEATIMAGNSMPVRDMDAFLAGSAKPLNLVANRGANGIDGVVSSALGAAAAGRRPVYLVIGDLSFYHDLNGLWAAGRHGLDITVVLVNNDGGGIFHYLPQAEHDDIFEEWFVTPSGLDFEPVVKMYGGCFLRPEGWDEFRRAIDPAVARGLRVVELRTDRTANLGMHREAWAKAGEAAWGRSDRG